MSSKLDYLKRYTAAASEDGPSDKRDKKKKKKKKKGTVLSSHLTIRDSSHEPRVDVSNVESKWAQFADEDDPVVVGSLDASPPRRPRHDSEDASPTRRPRHDSEDASPTRRPRHDSEDASPPRRPRHDSEDELDDASPPRRPRHDSGDASPPRRPRHDSNDASPPRRPRHDSNDASPPRRPRHDSNDASPPRRPRHDSNDASPSRRSHNSVDTPQPPKRPRHDSDAQENAALDQPNNDPPSVKDPKKQVMRFSGTTAGLKTGDEFSVEMKAARARKDAQFSHVNSAQLGHGSETTYRDKTGRKVDIQTLMADKARQEREEKEAEARRKYHWKTAKRDKQKALDAAAELEKMKSKPFARTADDAEMNQQLKEKIRADDPMAAYLTKKKDKKSSRKTYTGNYLPNRFDIVPGYRWDGVDRSNGFEKKLLLKANKESALNEEKYMWSVADM